MRICRLKLHNLGEAWSLVIRRWLEARLAISIEARIFLAIVARMQKKGGRTFIRFAT